MTEITITLPANDAKRVEKLLQAAGVPYRIVRAEQYEKNGEIRWKRSEERFEST